MLGFMRKFRSADRAWGNCPDTVSFGKMRELENEITFN